MKDAIDSFLAWLSSKLTYTGAGFGFSGWLFSSEAGVAVGFVGVFGGLGLTWYYKRKQDKREQAKEDREMAEHNRRMGMFE